MDYLVEVRASAVAYIEVAANSEDEAANLAIRHMDIDTVDELSNFEVHSVERAT